MKSSFLTLLITVFLLGSIATADVPQLLNYQGRLTDSNGDPLTGSYAIQFLIYNQASLGTAIWSETHGTVNVTEGVYQVLLGSLTSFPPNLFTSSIDRYLEIVVAGETLAPRIRFTSVSYSIQSSHSDSADVAASAEPKGIASGDLDGYYPSPIVDGLRGRTIANSAPTSGQVLKWNGSAWAPADDISGVGSIWQTSGSDIYYNAGKVGIGNSSPTNELDVTGTVSATTFSGSGASLSALNASNLSTGTIPTGRLTGTYSGALTFSNASNSFTGSGAGLTALNASNLSTGTIPTGTLSGTYSGALTFSNASNSFTGVGTGLTALNASNLSTGTIPTSRLTGTYSGALTFSNASNSFTGIGTGLTALNGSNISSGTVADARLETIIDRTIFNASSYMTALGGVHVGGTTDPGTDNLIVDGNVSIGTANSSAPLHVYSGTSYDEAVFIDHNGYASGYTYALNIDCDNSGTGYTHGIGVDVLNSYTGNSWTYGLRMSTTNDGGTYGAYGVQSNVQGTSTGNKYALWGNASGSGDCYGVRGYANGSATNYGGYFIGNSGTDNYGVYSIADKNYFESTLALANNNILASEYTGAASDVNVIAVYGNGVTNPGFGYGGYFQGGYRAVYAYVPSTSSTASCYAVYGNAQGTAGRRYGVYGAAGSTGTDYSYAFYGSASSGATYPYGIYATCGSSTGNYGGYFYGNLHSTGTNTESIGGTKIDHPLDPENKYLMHSNVVSPDMMNVYNGNVILNANGEAIVKLPDYFESLNKDFRYQLTCIGGFAQVYIAEKIVNNQFKIAGGKSGLEVSWQVTGVRHDPVAEKNRIVVELSKDSRERGLYQNPEAYNQPSSMSVETIHTIKDERE